MAESLIFTTDKNQRQERHKEFLPQLKALLSGETDAIATLSNASAAIKQAYDFHWVGFYLVKENQLVLGPFQGPIACTRIGFGKGVCGTAWKDEKSILVPDVDEFPGHIACSSLSKSELVVPLKDQQNKVWAVLDIDSEWLNDFNEEDQLVFEEVAQMISNQIQ